MTAETSPTIHGRLRVRPAWLYAAVIVVLAVALAAAQLGWVTPLDPVRRTVQQVQPQLLWVTGDFGSSTATLQGNHTVEGDKLILNGPGSLTAATATWSISFPDASDLHGTTIDFTFWVPSNLEFVHNDTPLRVSVDGRPFSFQPTHLEAVSDWPVALYVPQPAETQQLPGLFGGFLSHQLYVPFVGTFSSVNTTVVAQITVPAEAEAILQNVVFSASPDPSAASASGAQLRGWMMLPVLAAGVAAFVWALRKLDVKRFAAVFALGMGVRVALAPIFLHTDLITLTQFPTLFYPYAITNLQSFIYGPTWFVSLIAPASPFYAAGVTPSTDAFNVLFKLTPIAFDGLTYLVLLRLLTRLRDEKTAFRWATFGWLLNPLVVYFSAVHGLDDSGVAFFLVLAVYATLRSQWIRGAVSQTLAMLTLYPAAFALPPLLALERRPIRFVVAVLALPVALMVALFLAIYGSLGPAWEYIGVVLGTTSPGNLPTYGGPGSAQSPWLLLTRGFGLIPSPLDGVVVVVALFAILLLLRRPVTAATLPAAITLAMFAFYLSYQSFFVQLTIWIVPLAIVLLALAAKPVRRTIPFLLGTSVGLLAINLAASFTSFVTTVLSFLAFTALAVPLLTLLPATTKFGPRRLAPAVGTAVFGLALALLVLTRTTTPTTWDWVGLTTLVAAGEGALLVVPYVRPRLAELEWFLPVVNTITLAGLLGYLYDIFYQGTVLVTGLCLGIALVLVVYNLSRAAWHTRLWLGSDG